MLLPIIKDPNPILRQKTEKITDIEGEEVKKLIEDMTETLEESQGVGLAAPQVGKNLKIIVIAVKDAKMALINPRVTSKSFRKELGEEGCLSIPGVFGLIKRPKKIKIEALNPRGKKLKFSAEGLLARVIQHEIDHLDGILFVDKIKKYTETMVG